MIKNAYVLAWCETNIHACNSNGQCEDVGRRTFKCTCNEDYEGNVCQIKKGKAVLKIDLKMLYIVYYLMKIAVCCLFF